MANRDIELQHQIALCSWARNQKLKQREDGSWITAFDLLISFKNESKEAGTKYQIANRINRYKLAGLKPGTPDLIFAYPCNGYPGLFIEMKAPGKKSRENQLERQELMRVVGYQVVEADDWEKAANMIKQYLAGDM